MTTELILTVMGIATVGLVGIVGFLFGTRLREVIQI